MSVPRPAGRGATDRITIPCGKCMACLSRKRNQWAFRLSQELKNSKTAYFITMTYDDDHKPKNDSLCKSDCQLFLKRLRKRVDWLIQNADLYEEYPEKAQEWPKLRFFICGEYGPNTNRPHYHMLLFNMYPTIATANIIQTAWGKGHIHIGFVNPKTINYTVKYCINEIVEMKHKENTFILMSRRPGIGISYVEKMADYHRNNSIFYGIERGGIKVSMPRYYRDKIFNDQEIRKNLIKVEIERDKKIIQDGLDELNSKRQYTERIKKNLKNNSKL
jgi:hypothetical protein